MIAMVVCSPFVRHSQYHATRSLYTSSTTQFCRTTPLRVTISLHPWASFSSVHLFTTRYNPRVPVSSPPSAPGVNSLSVPELLLLLRGDSRCRRQHSLSDCLPTDLASMSSDCFSTTAKTERLPLLWTRSSFQSARSYCIVRWTCVCVYSSCFLLPQAPNPELKLPPISPHVPLNRHDDQVWCSVHRCCSGRPARRCGLTQRSRKTTYEQNAFCFDFHSVAVCLILLPVNFFFPSSARFSSKGPWPAPKKSLGFIYCQ